MMAHEAHRRGLRVIADLVPNHTSDQNPWFQASRDPLHPDHDKYRDWYEWSPTDRRYGETRIIFLDAERLNWTWDALCGAYYWHRFFAHQPDLNYDNPEVQQAMLDVVRFWLELGIDGFRVRAVPYLYEREGTNCENLPETPAYLKRLRATVDELAPGTLLLSEANQWPEEVRPYLGDRDEFHMNFHFPLMPRIFLALARADRAPILEILARTPRIPEACQWAIFLRCHDELTLEMVGEEERQFLWQVYAPEPRMRLHLGIRRRLAPLLGNDRLKYQAGVGGVYKVQGRVPILDQARAPVAGATVTAEWDLPDGQTRLQTAATAPNCLARFRVASAQAGLYTLTVLNVEHARYVVDPAQNLETSEEIVVP